MALRTNFIPLRAVPDMIEPRAPSVMPALVAGIHVSPSPPSPLRGRGQGVDGRDEPAMTPRGLG